MTAYQRIKRKLREQPEVWLVTGCAGFIGSHLIEELLSLGQKVRGLDNLSTGKRENLKQVQRATSPNAWERFAMIEGDIREIETCIRACRGVDYVLHQAALGSVPRSIEDPIEVHGANVTGFLNILNSAQKSRIKRFVYASSSAVYGDEKELPKVEKRIGRPLSPYAVTKYADELYAEVFERCYGLECVGLRYFNVFGPRQDPDGQYAAVIPKWIAAMQRGEKIRINGDGLTSRDFCYVDNVVQANILAAKVPSSKLDARVFNIAANEQVTLNELFLALSEALLTRYPKIHRLKPSYGPFRAGDVRHSLADISRAKRFLGYIPEYSWAKGIQELCAQ